MISFSTIDDNYREAFYSIMCEYLPGSDTDTVKALEAMWPKAFVCCVKDGQVIGVAYGWQRPDGISFCLDGIAIVAQFWHMGYGTALLSEFERAVRGYGAMRVSLGSAGGYVEDFYISCGYEPTEYKIYDEGVIRPVKAFEGLADYRDYVRPQGVDGFVVFEKEIGGE